MNSIAIPPSPSISRPKTGDNLREVAVWNCRAGSCNVYVLESLELVDPEVWRNVFAGHCKDHRYYEIVADTLNDQFEQKYFVIKNETTGEIAVQPFFFVDQDLVAGLPTRVRNVIAGARNVWPGFLKLKMMMVGCAAGEGQLDSEDPAIVSALHEALHQYAKREKAAMILLKDFLSKYRNALQIFSNNGYARVPSMPGARLAIDFKDFEDYMQQKLGRIFRKNLRRKFKNSAQFAPVTLEVVNDISPYVEELYPLYVQTYSRSQFQFEKLTKDYLIEMGRRMPERTRYFIWRQEGRAVAFALCMVHGDALYDLNVGMDYTVALDLHLYFLTFRDIIQWAAENKMKNYYTGPLNYDPKLHLRLELDPLDLYTRHTSAILNPVYKIALKYLQPARHDPVIRQFHNAAELN